MPSNASPVHIWLPELNHSTGGIQAYQKAFLASYAAARPEIRTKVFIKNDRPVTATGKSSNFSFVCLGSWPTGKIRTLVFALRLLWSACFERPRLIVVGHANFCSVAVWAQKLCGVSFLVIVHGIEVWGPKGARSVQGLRRAACIISVSRFTRDLLVREQGIDSDKILLLPNTVDPERFQLAAPSVRLREKLGISAGARIILTICRLSSEEGYKGYEQILRALPTVRKEVPAVHYVLGGRGDDLVRVQELAASLRVDDIVTLPGFVSEEELASYYQLCDVFAMPSRGEGFGIVFLEALTCGRAVLAGNRDGSTDALLDGQLGVLIDPEDIAGIADALSDMLTSRHPHPLVFQPAELRRRVIDVYGPARFAETLAAILDKFLPTTSAGNIP